MRLALLLTVVPLVAAAQPTLTVRAGRVIDGRGGTQRNVDIVIDGSRIARITPSRGGGDAELSHTISRA